MTNLSGKKAEDFVKWMELVKGLLPPSMTLKEAKEIFLRRDKEVSEMCENEAKN